MSGGIIINLIEHPSFIKIQLSSGGRHKADIISDNE